MGLYYRHRVLHGLVPLGFFLSPSRPESPHLPLFDPWLAGSRFMFWSLDLPLGPYPLTSPPHFLFLPALFFYLHGLLCPSNLRKDLVFLASTLRTLWLLLFGLLQWSSRSSSSALHYLRPPDLSAELALTSLKEGLVPGRTLRKHDMFYIPRMQGSQTLKSNIFFFGNKI